MQEMKDDRAVFASIEAYADLVSGIPVQTLF